jgi:drug/metabolite transporter (DMT)-like permease
MWQVWLGVMLIVAGLLLLAAPPIWQGRLSGQRKRSAVAGDTLEPRKPGAGFELASNWPGLVLITLGAVLLLVRTAL